LPGTLGSYNSRTGAPDASSCRREARLDFSEFADHSADHTPDEFFNWGAGESSGGYSHQLDGDPGESSNTYPSELEGGFKESSERGLEDLGPSSGPAIASERIAAADECHAFTTGSVNANINV